MPPTTQHSCIRVSERAKVEVRTASGTSRWISESSASLASEAAMPATAATSITVPRPYQSVLATAAAVASASIVVMIASEPRVRSQEPNTEPSALPPPAATASRPSDCVGVSPPTGRPAAGRPGRG